MRHAGIVLAWGLFNLSCAVGRGEGDVVSEDLFAEACHKGEYRMNPTFFSSMSFEEQQIIRVQRGDSASENSDELIVVVHDVSRVRKNLGASTSVGLAPELVPTGIPVARGILPEVMMTLHLGETCEAQVIALEAISGSITFTELWSGDEGDRSKKARLIEADFDVIVGDPRALEADVSRPEGYREPRGSRLTGAFRFYHRKGQPAQPFP